MFILRIHFRVMSMRILADSLPCDVVLCGEHEESPCVQRLIRSCVVSQSSSNVVTISVILGITAVEIAHPFEGQLTDVL